MIRIDLLIKFWNIPIEVNMFNFELCSFFSLMHLLVINTDIVGMSLFSFSILMLKLGTDTCN